MDLVVRTADLVKHFPVRTRMMRRETARIHAVDGVSLAVHRGETLGLVGESGCGKSTLGRCILRLYDLTAGQVEFGGRDISTLKQRDLRPLRREMQMIFQDPYASLNPRKSVGDIVAAPLRLHTDARGTLLRSRVAELLDMVGISPSQRDRYPSQFSGGQRQRIGIARAIAVEPRLIIADEPVASLDVSIQAQVLNLMMDLQEEFSLSYVFIAHDLGVIRHVADNIAVMYLGKIVESGPAQRVLDRPAHPYTEALMSAVPRPQPSFRIRKPTLIAGDPPSPLRPPTGCRFHTRCPRATMICANVEPPLARLTRDTVAACHHPGYEPTELTVRSEAIAPVHGQRSDRT